MHFDISTPPSVNAMYRNLYGKGRVKTARYKSWVAVALKELMAQHIRAVMPPVAIGILLPEKTRGDADGRAKPLIDLVVRANIIPDDSRQYVRSITIGFHDAPLTRVSVEPYRPVLERAAA